MHRPTTLLLSVMLVGGFVGNAAAQTDDQVTALQREVQALRLTALQRDVEALREGQASMQQELQQIKQLLRDLGTSAASAQAAAAQTVSVRVADAPFRGEANAPVTLVEFSDFGCPFCSRHVRETWPALEHYVESGQVKHVFIDYPIASLHPLAFRAHEAARCAGDQDRYWDMHAVLFANQSAQQPDALVGHADTLGLEMPTFRQCFDDAKYASAVRDRIAEAQRLRVTATPTFLLGLTDPDSGTLAATTVIVGAKPVGSFEMAIAVLLDGR